MTTDRDVFYGFVFEGQDYPPESMEEAARAVRRHLNSRALRRINDALLERLDGAKKGRQGKSKIEYCLDKIENPVGRASEPVLDGLGSPSEMRNFRAGVIMARLGILLLAHSLLT